MDRTIVGVALVVVCVPMAACPNSSGSGSAAGERCQYVEEGFGPSGEVAVEAVEVVDGLEVPWGVAFIDENDFLVTERPGRLRRVRDGELVDEPVLELTDEVGGGEGGLLDVVAHPGFPDNGLIYLYYTDTTGTPKVNRVVQYAYDSSDNTATRQTVIVDDIPAGLFHNGGRMRIGPDGETLYIGTGDARNPDLAQNPDSLAGKILRVELDGSVPADNPFGADNSVYIRGIRNTQGFGWLEGGSMAVADHGPSGELGRSDHDEANIAEAGDNLGWPDIYKCQDAEGMLPPLLTWANAVPPGGGTVYGGDTISEWSGDFIMGTLGSRHLHRVEIDEEAERVTSHAVYFQGDPPEGLGRLRDVMTGPEGGLYVTTSNCDGRGSCPEDGDKVLRIVPE